MSKFRRQRLFQSVGRKQRAKLVRSVAPCVIEGLEERQLMSLTIDLRMADGSKAANVTSVGQVLNLQLWAVVTGVNNPGTQDGFQEVIGSILSSETAPGGVHGNLSASVIAPFNDTSAQDGEVQDLNADGNLDVGSNDTTTSDNYFFSRDGGMDFNGTVSGNTNSFEIGTLTYTVSSLVYGQATDINFFPKLVPDFLPAAVWREDNIGLNNQNGTLLTGSPVVITSNAAPPVPTGSISGTVFNDTNQNGKQDSGETGISGATVYIDSNNNGVRDPGEEETTTNSSGQYTLTELPAGSYVVRQIPPTGEKQGTPASGAGNTVVLTTGQQFTSSNFGDMPQGTISGTVFNDTNVDSTLDDGEPGISGVTVYIDSNNNGKLDSGESSTTTNASGVYTFTGLTAGKYVVRQNVPSNDLQTDPIGGVANTITLANAQIINTANFGDVAAASITGTVFGSTNGSQTPLSGVTVYIDQNNNGSLDASELRVVTNASGVYTMTGLLPSPYPVRIVVPSGDTQTMPVAGTALIANVTVGAKVTGENFVVSVPQSTPPTGGSITGTVFNDINGNGTQDSGDLGIAGVTVYNDATNVGAFVAGDLTAVTNASGVYTLSSLPAGAYLIRQVLPSGDTQDFPTKGFGNHVTLTTNQAATGVNFGDQGSAVPPPTGGSISGTVFVDSNGDGIEDGSDAGIPNVTVYLDANNNGTLDTGEVSVITNASGVYTFTGLSAGNYLVREIPFPGDTQDFPTKGFGNHVTLATNQEVANVNFGDQSSAPPPAPGSISGVVFTDGNGNGIQDPVELGIPSITVYVDANNNGKLDSGEQSTTTDAHGNYTLPGLTAGTYLIRQVLPSGDAQDFPAADAAQSVTITTGQAASGINFGDQIAPPPTGGSITGTVFNDANGNGKQDAGELGIAGVFVYNDANNNGVFDAGELNTTTNASGVYSFSGLTAGAYLIRQILPTNDKQTLPTNGFGNHVTLTANQAATGANFGDEGTTVTPPPTGGSITGNVFNDANGNGKQDSGELGLNAVTVYLDLNNSGAFKTGDPETTTNASGVYSFSGLTAGAYIVRQILPIGDKQTLPSGGLGNHVTVVAGQTVSSANFGDEGAPVVVGPPPGGGSITGTVFNDANGNGKQDSGELGIANVEVYLDVNNAGFFVAGDPETTTNASGVYSFSGLAFGLYIVREIPPSGDTQTLPTGNLGIHINLAANQASTGDNFGDRA